MCSLATAVFILVALASSLASRAVQREASNIALDTLPGLVNAGGAISIMQENWLRLNLALSSASPSERAALMQEIRASSNQGLWQDYGQSVYDPQDEKNYSQLLAARSSFVRLREQSLSLTDTQSASEAKTFFEHKLAPAYADYQARSKKLFEYNAKIGRERAARVIRISRFAPYLLGASSVLVFGFGVVVGLRGALTGLDLTDRLRKP